MHINCLLLLLFFCKAIAVNNGTAFAEFFLQTKKGIFQLNDDNLKMLDARHRTIFLVHGWGEASKAYYYKTIPAEYLKKGDYNIVLVDWSLLASNLNYLESALNVRKAGNCIGQFIMKLRANKLDLKKMHIVSHSLGAHVAGFAGKNVFQTAGIKISRITALDPAGPGFKSVFNNAKLRLSKNDADMVDVLHTSKRIGLYSQIGTVDFYANVGKILQSPCGLGDFLNTTYISCSHRVSVYYYTESINSCKFKATDCLPGWFNWCSNPSTTIYGENIPIGTEGTFYFETNSEPPYAKD